MEGRKQIIRHVGEGEVQLIDGTGATQQAIWQAEFRSGDGIDYDQRYAIRISWLGDVVEGIDWNFYEALKQARKQLEKYELCPICYGASRQIVITGMAAGAGGRKVYNARLGCPLALEQLVYLMDDGPDVEPVSVAEQEEFQRQYWPSLKDKRTDDTPAPRV